VAHGLAEGLGGAARWRVKDGAGALLADRPLDVEGDAHEAAFAAVMAWLGEQAGMQMLAVGHRVVHGGRNFSVPVRIDDGVVDAIEALVPLAPLHQPHNLLCIRAARRHFAGVPQVACFDTAFHHDQPPLNQRFALPASLFERGIRRYGFHGLSYESIARQLPPGAKRTVVAHLGNGASLCAMRDGRSIATTMSFSPLDGLPMGTRCGRLDAAVVLYLIEHEHMDTAAVTRLLTRESGLLGLSGLSADMRELLASDTAPARLAVDYFVEHVQREIAAMAAALQGIDRLVFTGGIGENAASLRSRIVAGLAWMVGPLEVLVLKTNEEAVIAEHTLRHLAAPAA
jgi:acetate kinase